MKLAAPLKKQTWVSTVHLISKSKVWQVYRHKQGPSSSGYEKGLACYSLNCTRNSSQQFLKHLTLPSHTSRLQGLQSTSDRFSLSNPFN